MTRLAVLPDSPRLKALWASSRIATPGLAATIVVALASTYLSDHYRAPPVIFALLLGMALNTLSAEPRYRPGIDLSARVLLRISVALLGLRITFAQVGQLGWSTAAMVLVTVPATIGFGMLMARALKLDSRFGVLSGGAVGICGASAAMAIAVAWPRKDTERDTVVVIACITTYSTIAMILYPALLGHLTLDATQTGRILGGSIHDVAQVIAAGYASSQRAGDAATIVKLMRVAMLLPVVLTITLKTAERFMTAAIMRQNRRQQGVPVARISDRLRCADRPERLQPGTPNPGGGSRGGLEVVVGGRRRRPGHEDQRPRPGRRGPRLADTHRRRNAVSRAGCRWVGLILFG